jgi:hypothetical protein
MVELVAMAVVI